MAVGRRSRGFPLQGWGVSLYIPANPMGVQHQPLDRKPVRIRRGTAAVSEKVPGRHGTLTRRLPHFGNRLRRRSQPLRAKARGKAFGGRSTREPEYGPSDTQLMLRPQASGGRRPAAHPAQTGPTPSSFREAVPEGPGMARSNVSSSSTRPAHVVHPSILRDASAGRCGRLRRRRAPTGSMRFRSR